MLTTSRIVNNMLLIQKCRPGWNLLQLKDDPDELLHRITSFLKGLLSGPNALTVDSAKLTCERDGKSSGVDTIGQIAWDALLVDGSPITCEDNDSDDGCDEGWDDGEP